jgi:hypothetical protein
MVFPTEEHFRDTHTLEAAQAYRTLKLGMASMKARAEEGMFFTLEQRSLRNAALSNYYRKLKTLREHLVAWFHSTRLKQNEPVKINGPDEDKHADVAAPIYSNAAMRLHEVALSWMYDSFSEFGRNALRPAWCVIVLWLLFAIVYAAIKGGPLDPTAEFDFNLLRRSMLFSVEQVLRPLYVWGANTETLYQREAIPPAVQLLASLQSVMSFALLSLSLLALNWRFKRD